MTRRIHASTARYLRCGRCSQFGAPWVSDGRLECDRCRFDASMPEDLPAGARGPYATDHWAACAELVGRVPRRRGRPLDTYRYNNRRATLQQWADSLRGPPSAPRRDIRAAAMAAFLLTVLLGLFPHHRYPACVARRAPQIAAHAESAYADHGVPPAVMLVVGLYESHWGCHPASGGCWGAPVDVRHRFTAGTPGHAARALARSYAVCGTWRGAVSRFRSGLCRPWQVAHRAYVRNVMALVARLEKAAEED